jgi:hypothetical protein
MNRMHQLCLLLVVTVLAGCAHPISITPNLSSIDRKGVTAIDRNVGYYISDQDRSKEVTTDGGGGDKIRYTTYRDLEPALQKVLSNTFKNVQRMPAANDKKFIADNGISFVFIPQFTTESSSSGIFTWMATDFTVQLDCKALSPDGSVIWEKNIKDSGHADSQELMKDMQLSSRRASEKVFLLLQQEINTNPIFRKM